MDLKEIALNKSKKRHPWELARIEIITSILLKHVSSSDAAFNILDVGSGDVFLIKQLAARFKNAKFFAIDIGYKEDYMTIENNRLKDENLNITLFNDLEMAGKNVNGKIDLVLLLDVIEHVPDDKGVLLEIRNLAGINTQTLFVITVPAFQFLFCSHDTFLGHYRRYDNRLLVHNAEAAKLLTVEMGYFFFILLLPRILAVVIERIFGKSENVSGIGNWNGNDSISQIIKWILVFDYKFSALLRKIRIKIPGLSNYAVCKISV